MLFPRQQASDRLDLICRVFKMRLDELISDIKDKAFFGPVSASNDFNFLLFYIFQFYIDKLNNIYLLIIIVIFKEINQFFFYPQLCTQ